LTVPIEMNNSAAMSALERAAASRAGGAALKGAGRNVIARPRPYLQDAVARLHIELLKQLRDDSRRGSHAARSAVRPGWVMTPS
jgi:hypothetical protein